MSRIKLSYIHTYVDRHGRRRCYFRRAGKKRVALPGAPGSTEFMQAYQAALEGHPCTTSKPIGADRVPARSMSALITLYYTTPEFGRLAASTKVTYRNILERFRNEHGSKPVDKLEREHVRAILRRRQETPAAANNLLDGSEV